MIIVNWNGKQHLDDCLSSLRRQTLEDFETVLVDNGSTDDSVAYVQANYPEVRIIELSHNLGFCAPNNMAMAQSKSKYICLLNNDTELDSGCLEALVQTMEQDPRTGICDAKQLLFDQRDTVYSVGADYTIAGSTKGLAHPVKDQGLDNNRDTFIGMAACVLYRRSMLDEVGMFDEDFFAGCEDIDLSFRAHLAGFRVQNVGRSRCYHKISATHQANSSDYVRRGQRNMQWVYFKNMPSALLWRYFVHHLLYVLVTGLYFTRIGRGRAWLQAKLDVLLSIPRLIKKRSQAQALKRVSDQDLQNLLVKEWLASPAKREKMLSAWRIGRSR